METPVLTPAGGTALEERPQEDELTQSPWVTIVWNDPVNTIEYVIYVFQKLFGYGKAKARSLTMMVHNEGKAVVSSGTREQMEGDVARLHAAGLWATLQKQD